MDTSDKRELYSGFGNSLAQAFELAAIPALFALMGWGLDRLFGTGPAFVVIFVVLALIGLAAKSFYTYKANMDAETAGRPWEKQV